MPLFSSEPEEGAKGVTLPLRRTPPTGALVGTITCKSIVGTNTHWYGGRTTPCELPDCEPCAKSVGWRWHGYVSAIDQKTMEHFLFEFTAQAQDFFRLFLINNSSLRGCIFKATRMGNKPNGKVQIVTKRQENGLIYLPEEPKIEEVLCHIWGIEPEKTTEALYMSEHNGNEVRKTFQPLSNPNGK